MLMSKNTNSGDPALCFESLFLSRFLIKSTMIIITDINRNAKQSPLKIAKQDLKLTSIEFPKKMFKTVGIKNSKIRKKLEKV